MCGHRSIRSRRETMRERFSASLGWRTRDFLSGLVAIADLVIRRKKFRYP